MKTIEEMSLRTWLMVMASLAALTAGIILVGDRVILPARERQMQVDRALTALRN